MNVLLIFPPISDPRGPHLAPACLAASLRKEGHEVELLDLDLEMSLKLLEPENLTLALKRCKDKMAKIDRKERKEFEDASYWHCLSDGYRASKTLPNEIGKALSILRCDEFYKRERFKWARKTINQALNLISISLHPQLKYQMDGQIFETAYRSDLFSDLEKAVLDDEATLFGPLYDQEVLPRISDLKPDLIGISILNYQQIIPGLTLSYRLQREGWPVFIGGTVFVKFIQEIQKQIDFFKFCRGIIVYEGETALSQLLNAMGKGDSFENVPNLLFPSQGKVKVHTPFHVEDLNQLPTPDFDGLPLKNYLAPQIVLPYNLGKGCYWGHCYFCEIPFINKIPGKDYRVKDVGLIADQLQELSEKYHTPYFQFTDESCHPELLAHVSTEIMRRNLKIRYLCYARFDPGFSKKLCHHLYQGGCRKILFGLESGSQERLDAVNKGISVTKAEEILRNCADAHICFRVFAMIGLPHETIDEAFKTYDFYKRNRDLFVSPFNHFEFSPFHLDRHSCFAREPENYAIQDVKGNEEPFSLGGWDFKTEEGMDRKTLKRVYRDITHKLYHLLKVGEKYSGWEEYSLLTIDYLASEK